MDRHKTFNMKRKCADPFQIHKDQCRKKGLRSLPLSVINKIPGFQLTVHHRVCKQCKEMIKTLADKPIDKLIDVDCDKSSSTTTTPTTSDNENNVIETGVASSSADYALSTLNTSLILIGETPIKKRKLEQTKNYGPSKLAKISDSVKKNLSIITGKKFIEEKKQTELKDDYYL